MLALKALTFYDGWLCCGDSRVSDQNGAYLQWYIVEIYHSGRKPSICDCMLCWYCIEGTHAGTEALISMTVCLFCCRDIPVIMWLRVSYVCVVCWCWGEMWLWPGFLSCLCDALLSWETSAMTDCVPARLGSKRKPVIFGQGQCENHLTWRF